MLHLTDTERARYCFLLVIAQRDPKGSVARCYLDEKVEAIYKAKSKEHIRNMLDTTGRVTFDNIWDESLAPAHV